MGFDGDVAERLLSTFIGALIGFTLLSLVIYGIKKGYRALLKLEDHLDERKNMRK